MVVVSGLYNTEAVGAVLSIHVTVPVAEPGLPARSSKIKTTEPLPVNKYVSNKYPHISSLKPVSVANTFHDVDVLGVYITVHVGETLSIHVTIADTDHVLPAALSNSNVKTQLPVNV